MGTESQSALFHHPGIFSAFVTWHGEAAPRAVFDAARRLLAVRLPDETWALVLVDAALAPGSEHARRVLPRSHAGRHIARRQAPIAAQVSAPSREALVHALRALHAQVAGVFSLDDELLGGRLGIGREPFGYRDGLQPPTRDEVRRVAIVPDGPNAGGAWVLELLFTQALESFASLSPRRQDEVIGRTREGELVRDAPDGAHVREQYAVSRGHLIRRGFPWRSGGEEGLSFVAAARDPAAFSRALDAFLGASGPADLLLDWARPIGGGVYFAPPSDGWLRDRLVEAAEGK